MLNMNNERELAYVVQVDKVEPIVGSDNCEAAVIGGWRIMVRNGTFHPGDLAIYFEIDSQVPATETFAFLEKKNYKIKTQRYTFGGKGLMISQGLLMHPNDFGWTTGEQYDQDGFEHKCIIDVEHNNELHFAEGETRFLTKKLGVTYAVAEDNARKANSADKYKKMAQRNGKLFSKKPFRWLMRREWGRKLLFVFFGKQKDKKSGWPVGRFPGVAKTDQERCENMPWVLQDKTPFIVTQKCDGSSCTYILEKKKIGYEFYVCSRNVRMMNEDQECYHSTNVYWDLAKKYNIEDQMKKYLQESGAWFVCWQGEATGPSTQGNPHCLNEDHLYCFHMTDSITGRFDIREAKKIWDKYGLETVPIVNENYILPDDFEEFKKTADGLYDETVCGKPVPREGFVYYKTTDPNFSFKNVSREYLLKHHM